MEYLKLLNAQIVKHNTRSELLLSLVDYCNFRTSFGRYSQFIGNRMETYFYSKYLPESVLNDLRKGDAILWGDFSSNLSWLIMYMTDSCYSHIALYAGDGKIIHSTLDGTKYENISDYFTGRKVFLPVRLISDEMFDEGKVKDFDLQKYFFEGEILGRNRGYNFKRVIGLGITYLSCFSSDGFRWRIWFDLFFVFLTLGVVIFFAFGTAKFAIGCISYFVASAMYQKYLERKHGSPIFSTTPASLFNIGIRKGHVFLNLRGFQKHMLKSYNFLKSIYGEDRLIPGEIFHLPEGFDNPVYASDVCVMCRIIKRIGAKLNTANSGLTFASLKKPKRPTKKTPKKSARKQGKS